MVLAVAGEGTVAAEHALVDEFDPAVGGGRDVPTIEVNEVRAGLYAVRIVAGGARGLSINNVFPMSGKTLVG